MIVSYFLHVDNKLMLNDDVYDLFHRNKVIKDKYSLCSEKDGGYKKLFYWPFYAEKCGESSGNKFK